MYDVDFSNQEAVFNDLQEKYGEGNIARIVAFGTLQPKAVLRKVFSTFEYSQAEINQIARLIPPDAKSIKQLLESNTELSSLYSKYKTEFDVIVRIEGKISHESQHAGGAIIYPDLTHHLPVKTKAEDRTRRIVGFDKNMLEELGFYKMDILGLETLPIIKTCTDSIKETTGKEIDLYNIDYTDEGVYKMLSSGDVSGVFQLNNQAQKVMQQEPNKFDDLIAINALIRPAVGNWQEYLDRRKGKSWYVHPNRMNYMKDTVGIITYQEQYLLDCKILAGWEVAFSDAKVRKNKTIRQDEELKEKFVKDSLANGYDEVLIYDVWQEIVDAVDGGYSFNKAHATSYAVLSYQTAWLKYHYPEHFYAALMSHTKTDSDGQMEIAGYISECKEKGIKILPPDINISDEVFKVTEEGIQYRITAITHVGDSAIKGIKEIRPIKSFEDFIERRQKSTVRQNVIINLIKAGCFDFDNINRAELLWKFDMSNRTNKQVSENFTCEKYEWNDKIKSEWEKQVLGTYLSSHPMERYGFKPMSEFREGEVCLQGGDIYNVAQIIDRNGNEMAFVSVETLFGNLKVVVFDRQWNENNKEILQEGNRVMIKGRKSGNNILLNEAELLE